MSEGSHPRRSLVFAPEQARMAVKQNKQVEIQ